MLTRWLKKVRKRAVPWSAFGLIEDPSGMFYDIRARIVQTERTMHRVNRRCVRNALRRYKGRQAWEAA